MAPQSLRFLAIIAALTLLTPAAGAQDYNAKMRALNLARNTAIKLNGGLSRYVPEKCMFNSELPVGTCLIQRDESGFYYRFVGGEPGWQVLGKPPSTETLIQIAADGLSVVKLEYNGPLQGPEPPSSSGHPASNPTGNPPGDPAMNPAVNSPNNRP